MTTPYMERISPLEPNAEFIYAGDALKRRRDCEHLANIIGIAKTPYVMAVDAPWGAGKTVFLKMLQEECKKELRGFPCVFFNAWASDFHNDALAAMVGEIQSQVPKQEGLSSKIKKNAKNIGKKISWPALATLGGELLGHVAMDSATGGGATAATAVKAAPKIIKAGAAKKVGGSPVADYIARRDSLQKFRAELEKISTLDEDKEKPLVFFVDELDRCRPIFAIEVLEKIKHIFDVQGVFFVVAVDKSELQKTIQSVYGGISAEVYLRRFFDFEFALENRATVALRALERCNTNYQRFMDGKDLQRFFPLMCADFGLSCRDQEQAATIISAVAESALPNDKYLFSIHLAYFVILKFANPALFRQCFASSGNDMIDFPYRECWEFYAQTTRFFSGSPDNIRSHSHFFPAGFICEACHCYGGLNREELLRPEGSSHPIFWCWVRKLTQHMPVSSDARIPCRDLGPTILRKVGLALEARR